MGLLLFLGQNSSAQRVAKKGGTSSASVKFITPLDQIIG